ncbi:hypothetical protein LTR41_011483 [Exophiala xenobiotica]|nr:hypothetical protein LTR41_011483 [Exophiala xenobiotica]KAK5550261.1 hypothetical protein LTR46_011734 [Exophiala xenobiotica]
MSSRTVQDYHVGWICALNIELTAAMAMLDEEHEMIAGQDPQDHNSYVLGRIHQHHVVIACMPEGADGLVPAANVARDMARTCPALRVGLMVGIGGGIPDLSKGIAVRLGDIVVSKPEKIWGGVVQYDHGKAEDGGKFVVKGQLSQPPTLLLQALAQLRARHSMRPSKVSGYITEAIERNPMMEETGFTLPSESDCFYCSVCDNDIGAPVGDCKGIHAKRKQRKNNKPMVHYGIIASGNQVVKDAAVRDRLRDECNAFCVEMEAAGLMNEFPCLVIRGICDYADLHKNDAWHPYGAMTAAAYAKEFLQYISPAQASQEQPIKNALGMLDEIPNISDAQLEATKTQAQQSKTQYESEKHHRCLQTFKVLTHPHYRRWLHNAQDDLLWISADPGCGKSVLAKSLVNNELCNSDQHTVCYLFFKDNEEQDNVATALCALLHQLFSCHPELVRHAIPAREKNGDKLVKEVPELWRILIAAARQDQAHNWLIDLLSKFYTMTSTSSSTTRRVRLKFLVTSRPYDDIQAEFRKKLNDLYMIRLRGEDENDQIHREINLVIRKRLTELTRNLELNHRTVRELEDNLLKMGHRTYLWLYLAIEGIYETYRNCIRPEQASVELLPTTVEDAYDKILSRVLDKEKAKVKMILQILVGARRPLTVEEMAISLGIASTKTTQSKSLKDVQLNAARLKCLIKQWCGLFVFINHSRIYLIHQTAKEFLLSNGTAAVQSGWKHCLDLQDIERLMTEICLDFWSFDDIKASAGSIVQRLKSPWNNSGGRSEVKAVKGLIVYTAEYWSHHRQHTDIPASDQHRRKICDFYDTSSDTHNLWFPVHWWVKGARTLRPKMTSLRLAAYLGDAAIIKILLQQNQDSDLDGMDQEGRTALVWASGNANAEIVRMLVDAGADVNAQGDQCGSALQTASLQGKEKLVQILIDRRADINADGGTYGNALQAAAIRGREKEVQILLGSGADVNKQGGRYGTALQAASLLGFQKVVQMLMDEGANANAQGGEYGNALQAASMRGYEKVVQMLLKAGAVVHTQGGEDGMRGKRHQPLVLFGCGCQTNRAVQHKELPCFLPAEREVVMSRTTELCPDTRTSTNFVRVPS